MRIWKLAASLMVWFLVLGLAEGKPKKPDVPGVFQNAKYVFVEAVDGDTFKPGLYPEDRQAIYDVQDSLRDWNRYTLTTRRDEAELVFVVRKGRLAGAQVHGGISGGSRPQPGQAPSQGPGLGQGQTRDGTEIGARGEVDPEDDLLRVYVQNDGKLNAIVWTRELEDGLEAPAVQLVKQLRAAVERAYPQTPTAKTP
jgi:hypothetical protein